MNINQSRDPYMIGEPGHSHEGDVDYHCRPGLSRLFIILSKMGNCRLAGEESIVHMIPF